MSQYRFASVNKVVPAPALQDQAKLGLETWSERAENLEPEQKDLALKALEDASARRLLECLFGNSPYLGELACRDQVSTLELLIEGPAAAVESAYRDHLFNPVMAETEADISRRLRRAKRRVALALAVADITCHWDLDKVTYELSSLADRAVGIAGGHLLQQLHDRGKITLPDAESDPWSGSGLIVLGMGKLGAFELNYSSDIDLIILFDADRITTPDSDELQTHMSRLARGLGRLLGERTSEGYVFRTDLRLRPDPNSTPPALSVLAAETYYESIGQNWERAAMIKARAIAADQPAATAFLRHLRPFVWRKSLDFHAIRDVQSIKRQIHAHKGGGEVRLAGHNIKLGRGGIREIEFFAQTQQLIWGGRETRLRERATQPALIGLSDVGYLDRGVAVELIEDYRFLRTLEHRLQMIHDEQTQTLPDDEEGLRHLSVFMGFDSLEAFATTVLATLRRVESHYADLFEDEADLSDGFDGNLSFTGGEPDPDTLKTLERLGYQDPAKVDAVVRGWHHGRYRATTSARARELLTELMPSLLSVLGGTPEPDQALIRFDAFLRALPAGVQLFSMFHSNPQLLDLLAEVMGGAPRLAQALSARPAVLDGVLAPDFLDPPSTLERKRTELGRLFAQASVTEDALDLARRWSHDRRFQIGVKRLRDLIDVDVAGRALSDIAEVSVAALVPFVIRDFMASHGTFARSGVSVVAYGKLGAREMTHESDLDLVIIYGVPEEAEASDGPKPLPPSLYYARLAQRLVGAITAPTAEGELYEVDLRLRPAGAKGPLASRCESFVQYQQTEAWTWEHMALTRARVIAGPADLADLVTHEIRAVLSAPRDRDKLLLDVASMRRRLMAEKASKSLWSLKHLPGGLMDLDFIAQYLQLRHAEACPEVLATSSGEALQRLAANGFLDGDRAERLIGAHRLWRDLQGLIRLALPSGPDDREAELPARLKDRLIRAAGVVDFDALKAKIQDTAMRVEGELERIVLEPAAQLKGKGDDDNGT